MLVQSLQQIINRDLIKLRQEISSYKEEEKIWHVEKNIANSAGNLCLHLIGNLNTYIGAQYGQTGYVRNRELEFSQKNVSRNELIKRIDDTIRVMNLSLANITDETLKQEYPIQVFSEKMTTEYFLVHLATHLTYHLGQINYHRRILDTSFKKINYGFARTLA
jgi:uncharacterized damage-inducible protein DinB